MLCALVMKLAMQEERLISSAAKTARLKAQAYDQLLKIVSA